MVETLELSACNRRETDHSFLSIRLFMSKRQVLTSDLENGFAKKTRLSAGFFLKFSEVPYSSSTLRSDQFLFT